MVREKQEFVDKIAVLEEKEKQHNLQSRESGVENNRQGDKDNYIK